MELPVSGKKGKGLYFQIDEDDYPRIKIRSWSLSVSGKNKYYLHAGINSKVVRLHRYILNAPPELEVDHINGDGLDNRKSNLRLCTSSQNNQNASRRTDNTSGYKGVNWFKPRQRWVARIQVDGKRIGLGSFKDKEMANVAYNQACIKYHQEFAKPNS